MMVEAGIEHRLVFVKQRRLLQVSRAKVVAVDDLARVVALFTSNHRQQGRLARTVLGNESYLLSCRYGERYIPEEQMCSEALCQMLYVEVWCL